MSGSGRTIALAFLGGGLFGGYALMRRRRQRSWMKFLAVFALSFGLAGSLAGCGNFNLFPVVIRNGQVAYGGRVYGEHKSK
jgi:hypothetical protein